MSLTFAQLGVPESILKPLIRRGITNPFEIQASTLPNALAGRDICGRAPTGSGKTLAYGIALVARVKSAEPRKPRALVLAPTRELAEQITMAMRTFSGPKRIAAVYGGVGYGGQIKALKQGIEILVACPGRLEDLIAQRVVDLGDVDIVVLDEADRMADMGFTPAVRRLLDQTSKPRQTMLYSATLDGDVANLTRDYQDNPARHAVAESTPDITPAHHVFWNIGKGDRVSIAADAVNAAWPAMVFCRTRHGADRLTKQFNDAGIRSVAIHGGRSQSQRTRALADFVTGKADALVASDVAARGIHVDNVASVIHFDPPEDHKMYVHRSGRTARAGQSGVVLSLVTPNQVRDARRMQRQTGFNEAIIAPDISALQALSPALAKKSTSQKHSQTQVELPSRPFSRERDANSGHHTHQEHLLGGSNASTEPRITSHGRTDPLKRQRSRYDQANKPEGILGKKRRFPTKPWERRKSNRVTRGTGMPGVGATAKSSAPRRDSPSRALRRAKRQASSTNT
jgi:superfamily II DNA/RNA helicase